MPDLESGAKWRKSSSLLFPTTIWEWTSGKSLAFEASYSVVRIHPPVPEGDKYGVQN